MACAAGLLRSGVAEVRAVVHVSNDAHGRCFVPRRIVGARIEFAVAAVHPAHVGLRGLGGLRAYDDGEGVFRLNLVAAPYDFKLLHAVLLGQGLQPFCTLLEDALAVFDDAGDDVQRLGIVVGHLERGNVDVGEVFLDGILKVGQATVVLFAHILHVGNVHAPSLHSAERLQ